MSVDVTERIGFAPDEMALGESTRAARLKWVVVVDQDLPAGRAANAAVCVAAATTAGVDGLLGPHARDQSGVEHPGIPWVGCTILAASTEQLGAIRSAAAASHGMFVADMPAVAQTVRVYEEYLDKVAGADEPTYIAVSVVGPRNQVDRLVRKLPLLS